MLLSRRKFLGSAVAIAAHGLFLPRLSWSDTGTGKVNSAGKLRIGYFTDLHLSPEPLIQPAIPKAAAAIAAAKADLYIGGGDFITGGFESTIEAAKPRWEVVTKFKTELAKPFIAAIGNHDLVGAQPALPNQAEPDPRSEFKKYFGLPSTRQRIEYGGFQIIVLDAIEIVGGKSKYRGRVDDEQLEWIRAQLAAIPAEQPIILVTHLPFLTAEFQAVQGGTTPAPAFQIVSNGNKAIALFDKHNLRLVLQGHLHVSEILVWRNTTFITGGAICGSWWHGSHNGTAEGFGVVSIDGPRVDWEYRSYGWHAG